MMGLTALGEAPPRALEDIEQHAFIEMPTVCKRCKSPNLIHEREVDLMGPPRRVHCFMCGWDAFFVMSSRGEIPILSVRVETGQGARVLYPIPITDVVRKQRKSRL